MTRQRRSKTVRPQPQADSFTRETRRDTVALVVSTLGHMLILVIGALFYVGGGSEEPTVITTSWADEGQTAVDISEPVELLDEPTSGGMKTDEQAAVKAVATSSSGSAATAAGLTLKPASASLGGAFFGSGSQASGAYGKRIVYIVDASGSMDFRLIRQSRFRRVQTELETSILSLHESQKFAVILFNDQARTQSRRVLRAATERNKTSAIRWIHGSEAGGDTKPQTAIKRALRMKPDTIYFLTDGVFQPVQAAALMKRQKGLTVHTFTLGDSSGEAIMRRIADANRGQYRFIDGRKSSTDQSTAAANPNSNSNIP